MRDRSKRTELKKEFRKLFRAMDFISSQFNEETQGKKKDIRVYFDVYQLLGYAWELLSLQCNHREGYKRTKGGDFVCRICGTIKGVQENYFLLPRLGLKRIGEKRRPDSREIFSSKKRAQITKDTIVFHGASLDVDVHNAHKKRLGRIGRMINMAAERIVSLKERGVECTVDDHLITVKLPPDSKWSKGPKYGGFPWELKRDHLKKFPVLFDFDKNYKLLGLSILSGAREPKRKRVAKKNPSEPRHRSG